MAHFEKLSFCSGGIKIIYQKNFDYHFDLHICSYGKFITCSGENIQKRSELLLQKHSNKNRIMEKQNFSDIQKGSKSGKKQFFY